jgi:hypothetical protein
MKERKKRNPLSSEDDVDFDDVGVKTTSFIRGASHTRSDNIGARSR